MYVEVLWQFCDLCEGGLVFVAQGVKMRCSVVVKTINGEEVDGCE